MPRIAIVLVIACSCAVWVSPRAAAGGGALAGDVPLRGGLSIVVFEGGSVTALEEAAAAQGCALRSVYAYSEGRLVGYLVGAPSFVNRRFEELFPAGVTPQMPLIIACHPVPFAPAARQQPGGVDASIEVIGMSAQGRSIQVVCLGDGDRSLLLVGGLHTGPIEAVSSTLAREVLAAASTGALAVPSGARVCVVPTLNPDGLAQGTRTNANGVDLNRNWPAASWSPTAYHPEGGEVSGGTSPLSEPETRALYEYIIATRPTAVIVWHCCASVVEGNAGPAANVLAQRYAAASGLEYIERWTDYPLTGQFLDAMDRLGVAAMDVEMEQSDQTGRAQHLAGVAAVLRWLEAAP